MNFRMGAAIAAIASAAALGVNFVAQTLTLDFGAIVQNLAPSLADTATALIMALLVWFAREFKKKTNIDLEAQLLAIEARHREAYQSALKNAAGALAERVGKDGKVEIDVKSPLASQALELAIGMVKRNVPDAVKAFHREDADIGLGILAKLPEVAKGEVAVVNVPAPPVPKDWP